MLLAALLAAAALHAKVLPPAHGMYHAAYPGFCAEEDCVTPARVLSFEKLVGRRIAWAYFSDNWFHGIHFPERKVRAIWSVHRTIPFVRLMARATWDEGCRDKTYSLDKIVAGDFDDDLRQYARDAAATNIPLLLEFGTEANGDWFPWSGPCNGGPAAFKAAWRHVVSIFRAERATNVTWVLHLDASEPQTIAAYYPGAAWVDWVGLSAYGAQVPGDDWRSFRSVFEPGYRALARAVPRKPIALLELGVIAELGHDKAAWIASAFRELRSGRYPRLKAVSWWNSNWTNEGGVGPSLMRVDTSRATLAAYRAAVATSSFVSAARVAASTR